MAYVARKFEAGSSKKKKEPAAERSRMDTARLEAGVRQTVSLPSSGQGLSASKKEQIDKTAEALKARHGSNIDLFLYDLDSSQKEIDALEETLRQLQRDASIASSYNALRNTYLGAPVRNNFDILYNTAATRAVQEELSAKRRTHNLAKHYQETVAYEDTVKNEDFAQFDDYIPSDDPLYNWINDQQFRESYEAPYQSAPNPNVRKSKYVRKGYDRMTDDEIAIYNYYYAKGGKAAAQKYLESIQETLNGRIAEDLYGRVQDNTAQELTFGITAGFNQAGSNAINFFNTQDDYIPLSPYQIASGKVREDLADTGVKLPEWLGGASLGQVAYDTISTTANMAPSMLVSAVTGTPLAGSAMMGISAAGGAYQQALNEGFSKDQARGYSILVGVSETVLEKALGGISALGGNKLGKVVTQNLANADTALKKLAWTLGGNIISEFREEYLQEVLDPVFRNIALKTDEEIELFSPEALYSGFLGALTGPIPEGVTWATTTAQEKAAQVQAQEGMGAQTPTQEGTDAQVQAQKGMDEQTPTQKKKPDYWDPMIAMARLVEQDRMSTERARVDTISTIQGIDPNDAVAITDILEHTKTASTEMDALAAREAYLYGYYGVPDKLLSRHPLFYTALPDSRQQEIYDIGKNARDRSIETKWQKMQEKKRAAALPEMDEFADFNEEIVQPETDTGNAEADFHEGQEAGTFGNVQTDGGEINDELLENAENRDILDIEELALMANCKKIPNAKERSRVINEAINLQLPVYAEELRAAYKGVKPKDGFMDICLHGTQYYATYEHQYILDPDTLYLIISGRKEYQKQYIRLLSCGTGKADRYGNCFAQELADRLGVGVYAPIDTLYIGNGELKVGKEKLSEEEGFKLFKPRHQRRKTE